MYVFNTNNVVYSILVVKMTTYVMYTHAGFLPPPYYYPFPPYLIESPGEKIEVGSDSSWTMDLKRLVDEFHLVWRAREVGANTYM